MCFILSVHVCAVCVCLCVSLCVCLLQNSQKRMQLQALTHTLSLSLMYTHRLRDVDAAIHYCKQQQQEQQPHQQPHHQQPFQHQQQQHPQTGMHRPEAWHDGEAGGSLWFALLEMYLNPGQGARPSYADALRVLDAQQSVSGSNGSLLLLDPQWVLNALGDAMPLHLAAPTLSRMLCALGHRRRHAQVRCFLCPLLFARIMQTHHIIGGRQLHCV